VRHIHRVHTRSYGELARLQHMGIENDILDPKIHASANINDPTCPGPDGKMSIFKRNLTLVRCTSPRPSYPKRSTTTRASPVRS
jgi:hypothetical protein